MKTIDCMQRHTRSRHNHNGIYLDKATANPTIPNPCSRLIIYSCGREPCRTASPSTLESSPPTEAVPKLRSNRLRPAF